MAEVVNWGILGAGSIARKFAAGLQVLPDAQLTAIGSRSQEKADGFGDEFGVPVRCGSYEDLVRLPEVDVIYVATPHPMHKDHSLMCLEAGKAVLCEKPFTVNAAEARQVIDCARRNQVFLMEAMWTRFLPVMVKVREWLQAGAIGQVRMLTADFGFRSGWNPEGRLLNPELGGGSLLDVGVYTIALAYMVYGRAPSRVVSLSHLGVTGVDEQAAYLLGYDQGELAVLSSAVRTNTPHEARLDGTQGRIAIEGFWHATQATLSVEGMAPEVVNLPFRGNGYECEAEEVMRCLRAGELESAVIPLSETLAIMETLDELRRQWGLKYPME